MTVIRKSSGYKEEFNRDKIVKSIKKAAIDAGYSTDDVSPEIDKIKSIIDEMITEKQEINSDAIRDHILNELKKNKPDVAHSWLKFDEKYKY